MNRTEREKEIEAIIDAGYRRAVGKHFTSGKTKNKERDKLGKLLGIGKTKKLAKEKSLGRNSPCFCGSGKKYKNCHMLLTTEKLVMKREENDWAIKAFATLRIDNRKKSQEVLELTVTGTINGELEVGHAFDLGEIHINMQGDAEIVSCTNGTAHFTVKNPCEWPREWNEPWAK